MLDSNEVEMIREALQICYDDDLIDDLDTLENLCHVFAILDMTRSSVKVATTDDSEFSVDPDNDECCGGNCDCHRDTDDDDTPDTIDPDDLDDDDYCDDPNCSCRRGDRFDTDDDAGNSWNANVPWNTEDK
jgi:hypothetical protein